MSKHYAEFKVGDILSVVPTNKPLIEGKGGYIKDDEIVEENGSYPYISAVSTNNGIKGWTNVEPENSAGSITLSTTADSSNTIFYQPVDYVGRQQIAKIQHRDLSPLTQREAMYIATLLRKITQAFNYGNKLTKDSLVNTCITLPVTDDTIDTDSPEPDWEYMEEYIKSIEERYLDSVEQYNRKNEDILDALHPDYHDEAPEAYDYAEFRVGELFEITPTKWYKNNPVVEEELLAPQVSNTTQPNGITSFEKYPANNDGNVITFSDTTVGGETLFYQPVDFIGYSHVQKIVPIGFELNQKIAHYVISSFRKAVDGKFNYAAKFNRENASNTLITLPVTSDGKPDWLFMEEYINFIEGGEEKSQTTCSTRGEHLEATHSKALVEPEFKEFRVEDLFEITTHALHNSGDFTIEGEIPYITRTTFNNGVAKYVDEAETKEIVSGNAIAIAGETAKLYYQPYDFVVGTKVAVMRYEAINRENAMYVISAIEKSVSSQFGFSNILTGKKLKELTITLPATPSGDPDWEYMQSYIKEIDYQKKMQINNYVEYKNRT